MTRARPAPDPDDATIRALVTAHEDERRRLAKELHDDIGQRLAVLTMDLDSLGRMLPLPADEAAGRLRVVSDRALALAKDVQARSHRLYPPRLEHLGVVSACASYCREVSKQSGIDVVFVHHGVPDGLPAAVALTIFRVLEESVANAMRHSGAGRVDVAMFGQPDHVRLEIIDAGAGFDVDAAMKGGAVGLIGMTARARLVGGDVVIESGSGAGTSVRARVPLSDPSSA